MSAMSLATAILMYWVPIKEPGTMSVVKWTLARVGLMPLVVPAAEK